DDIHSWVYPIALGAGRGILDSVSAAAERSSAARSIAPFRGLSWSLDATVGDVERNPAAEFPLLSTPWASPRPAGRGWRARRD
ncbi:MAG TPA: hypothetical protein VG405_00810, partial [Solirubrobacteraceae bacterium]|nr:hypothetical protein [Solirubrobacteraceae bacterium]